jgi:hypothetical protein
MESIDRRTRFDHDVLDLGPDRFFAEHLPALIDRHGHLAAAGFEQLRARPLTVKVDGFRRTLTGAGGRFSVVDADVEGAATVELDAAQFSDWAQQVRTFSALSAVGELRWSNGSDRQQAVWDALWIALLEGWPVVESEPSFVDRDGAALDLARCFTPDDDPDDVAHFLREAGYLHLRGWLDPSDMAVVSDDMDRAVVEYTDGDDRSWWATLSDGSRRCVRMQHFVQHSPTTAELLGSERWRDLRETISGNDQLVQGPVQDNCIEALIKPLAVANGVSDIPWHRDCNFGRHAYGCSSTTIGVSVTAGAETTGLLRVVAGSHRIAMPPVLAYKGSYLPIVSLPTQAGDVTVHLSCTLHEAMPPLTAERKVMYTGFGLPPREGEEQVRRKGLGNLRERAARTASQPASPLAAKS